MRYTGDESGEYYYRIFDRHKREVVGLAVLADERSGWRADHYTGSRWGCELQYRYPTAKLADWREELQVSDNPFATVLLAHLAAQETRRDADARKAAKSVLFRRLYQRG